MKAHTLWNVVTAIFRFQAWKSGPREVKFRYDLSAAKDVPVTLVVARLGVEKAFSKGEWVLTHTDGKTSVCTRGWIALACGSLPKILSASP
ncbi:MAG: hypothetical protein AAB676_15975 [Verrucomicrobiota bacterium]